MSNNETIDIYAVLGCIEWLENDCYVESPQDEIFDKCVSTIKVFVNNLRGGKNE